MVLSDFHALIVLGLAFVIVPVFYARHRTELQSQQQQQQQGNDSHHKHV